MRNNKLKNIYLDSNEKLNNINRSILIVDSAADQCTCGGPAWIVLEKTGQEVRCNGYLKGKNGFHGPILPIVNAVTCVDVPSQEPFLLIMNQSCYYDDEEQDESLCLPFQAMQHGVTFDLTPHTRTTTDGKRGTQRIILAEKDIPLQFDGRKLFINIRKPSNEELELLPSYKLTSPNEFIPDSNANINNRRKSNQKIQQKYPGNLTLEEWRDRLALAPEEVVKKTLEATTQMAMSVEVENREIPRRHYVSRFPFLKEKRINDTFHTDTFFPSVHTNKGETCSQLFIGEKTDYMSVYPLKSESHNHTALQDFGRTVGIPSGIKSDNAKSETGQKWLDWCRKYCVSQSFTEPKSPWQNFAEQGIGDLGRMVKRCMRKFQVPLSRHGWCQLWCKDVRNHLASRKLSWRTPME